MRGAEETGRAENIVPVRFSVRRLIHAVAGWFALDPFGRLFSTTDRDTVSADLLENTAGWGRVQDAMSEIRACHGEFQGFFAGVLDELDSLSAELAQRQHQWHRQRQQREDELRQQKELLEEQRAAVAAHAQDTQHAGDLQASAVVENSRQIRQVLDEIRQERAELCQTQEAVQSQLARLAAVAAELAEIQEKRPVEGTMPAGDTRHEQLLEEARSQQVQWEKERAVLEAELEAVRNRAAEMSESLTEQKRLVGQQQNQWSEELKRMRCALEDVSRQWSQEEPPVGPVAASPQPPPVPPPAPEPVAAEETRSANEDAALSSVMAQFEMLQRDLARRRATGA